MLEGQHNFLWVTDCLSIRSQVFFFFEKKAKMDSLQLPNNSDKYINSIEKFVDENNLRHYDIDKFENQEEIGHGAFGVVDRVNYVNCDASENLNQYYALKSFHNFNDATAEAIAHEVMQLW
jgi:hypothetical protein